MMRMKKLNLKRNQKNLLVEVGARPIVIRLKTWTVTGNLSQEYSGLQIEDYKQVFTKISMNEKDTKILRIKERSI